MGRQAYLTRLALGRSAFETPDQIPSEPTEDARLEPSSNDATLGSGPNDNSYVQVYDDRGHPINPRSREHGRLLREAQNDVLAAIGVVERRPSPPSEMSLQYLNERKEKLEMLEAEDSVGNSIAIVSALSKYVSTWWIDCLRDGLLTFNTPIDARFTELVSSQYRLAGFWSFFCAGFPAHLLSSVAVQITGYIGLSFRPIERLLLWARASRRTKRFFQKWRPSTHQLFRLCVELAFCPLFYHAALQRLHLIPARPVLPPLESFVPFTAMSPIQGISVPTDFTAGAILGCIQSLLASPLVLLCLEQYAEKWVYGTIYEAIDSSTIQPDNPDLVNPDDTTKRRAAMILGLRKQTPMVARNAINRLMTFLQWGRPYLPPGHTTKPRERQSRDYGYADRQSRETEIGGRSIIDLSPLELPLAHTGALAQQIMAESLDAGHAPLFVEPSGPFSPVSHTASEASLNMMDPTVRITSRDAAEGIVELEVRLPHVTSIPVENAEADLHFRHLSESPTPGHCSDAHRRWPFHRVTQLSLEPGQMLGTILKNQMVTWLTLPLRIASVQMVALQFLRSDPRGLVILGRTPPLLFNLWSRNSSRLGLRAAGILSGKLALCGVVEVALDLTLWGCQWIFVTWVGKRFFGWGRL
ncbi:hypothetical protein K432DRAFT_363251 [Lepidopterella palustris CBS 459.81]|uniref:Uncharacterized protein n=1 Tax=Lepidopterella palustris CBS 459.81 TaxID=1314670 RepID=A0A8E2DZW3_9PEZI|nr:hypothetical protein K432DRAFT_363251 [Lepidopterella palustris CBS 459.81]